jgi:hypothetical protein
MNGLSTRPALGLAKAANWLTEVQHRSFERNARGEPQTAVTWQLLCQYKRLFDKDSAVQNGSL